MMTTSEREYDQKKMFAKPISAVPIWKEDGVSFISTSIAFGHSTLYYYVMIVEHCGFT